MIYEIFNLPAKESGLGKDWIHIWIESSEESWWRDFWVVETIGL